MPLILSFSIFKLWHSHCVVLSIKVTVPFHTTTYAAWAPVALLPHQHLELSSCFVSHSSRCVVVSHCGYNLCFPNGLYCWVFFMCLFAIFESSLLKCLLKSFVHFQIGLLIFLFLNFKIFFIFWTHVLYHIWDIQIFSPGIWFEFSSSYPCLLKSSS